MKYLYLSKDCIGVENINPLVWLEELCFVQDFPTNFFFQRSVPLFRPQCSPFLTTILPVFSFPKYKLDLFIYSYVNIMLLSKYMNECWSRKAKSVLTSLHFSPGHHWRRRPCWRCWNKLFCPSICLLFWLVL